MDQYIKNFTEELDKDKKSIHTIIAYKKDLEQLDEYIKLSNIKNPADVTEDILVKYFDELKKQNLSAKTVSRKINSTRTFFKYLQTLNIVDKNPAILIAHPKIKNVIPRILTEVEFKALRDTAKNDTRTALIIEILLQTGIRIGELCRIKTTDLHMTGEEKYIHIIEYGTTPSREVPLNDQSLDVIRQYISIRPKNAKTDNLFITKNGNPLLVRNIRTSIDGMFRKAGIENAKVNDLRNTFIAHHLSRGTNIYALSKIIGHKRIATTEKYLGKIKIDTERLPNLPIL